MTFTGFPTEALDFYDDLELDNTKSYWTAHKNIYDTCVKAPMIELTSALEEEFGPAKVFRPYRDVRFAKDKTPYKNHQGAYVASSSGSGWYVQISAAGVYVAVGYYEPPPMRLPRSEERSPTNGAEHTSPSWSPVWSARAGRAVAPRSRPGLRGTPLITRASSCCGTSHWCCTRATALRKSSTRRSCLRWSAPIGAPHGRSSTGSEHIQARGCSSASLRLLGYGGTELRRRHPSAEAFALMTEQLAGAEAVTCVEVPEQPDLYSFDVRRGGRGPLLVVWQQRDSFSRRG